MKIPKGWKLVPIEPTDEMIEKLTLIIRQSAWGRGNVVSQYKKLIEVAPDQREANLRALEEGQRWLDDNDMPGGFN